MYIGAPLGRLGLRGAAARRSATWPLGPFGLGATSHTCPRYAIFRQAYKGYWARIPYGAAMLVALEV